MHMLKLFQYNKNKFQVKFQILFVFLDWWLMIGPNHFEIKIVNSIPGQKALNSNYENTKKMSVKLRS